MKNPKGTIFLVLTFFLLNTVLVFAQVRVTSNLQVLYNFSTGSGNTISDNSDVEPKLDLTIDNTGLASWTDFGLNIHGNARIKSSVASKIIDSCKNSNEMTFEAWLLPSNVTTRNQHTRVFTISKNNTHERNFGFIQNKTNNYYLFRTSETDLNGGPASELDTTTVELTHFVFTRAADGTIKTYRDGALVLTESKGGDLSNWDDGYSIILGNGAGGPLYWEGTYYLTAIYSRALTGTEVLQNYNSGVASDDVPSFAIEPTNQFVLEGQTVTFNALAISIYPVTYQWQKNGSDIPGATSSSLSFATTSVDDEASITCVATSSAGSTTSSSAIVSVATGNNRVTVGQQVLYNLSYGSGNKVYDVSNEGSALNFTIFTQDAVEWLKEGLKIKSTPSIVTTAPANKIINACKNTNEITVEMWVKAANTTQAGPAKIVTLSTDENTGNFSVGQITDTYEAKLKTTSTTNDGLALTSSAGAVSVSGFDHVVYTRDSDGNTAIYVNAAVKNSGTAGGDFSNWDGSFLSLGNEIGGTDLHWEGVINLVAVFNRALTQGEVGRNYNLGPIGILKTPTELSLTSNQLYKVTIGWTDNSVKEIGYIIERSETTPAAFTVIDTVLTDEVSFIDSSFINNKTYTYRIKAFNENGESDYSNILSVHTLTIPVVAPTSLAFSLHAVRGIPVLTWDDNSDNETGFKIERRGNKVGNVYEVVASVDANETTFLDKTVSDSSVYNYRVFAFKVDTVSDKSNEIRVDVLTDVESEDALPKEYSLAQNYPNPFNPSTKINFGLPEKSDVTLKIFNLLGQEVLTILEKEYSAGNHTVNFNANDLTSGIYIYAISARGINGKIFKNSKKMILMK